MSHAAPPLPVPNRQTAELHLHLLAPGTDRFTFQSYTDYREKRDEYKARGKRDPVARILHGSLAERWDELVRLSAAGAGIYVTVNETNFRGRAAANIIRVRARFVDLDGAPLENLRRITLPPHFGTQPSPNRFHGYWLVKCAALDDFKPIQQRLVKLMEGDPNVCDLPRVLRLAGFPNQKDPTRPFLVTIGRVSSASESPYSDADFQAALAAAEKTHAHLTKPAERRNLAERALASLPPGPPDMRQGYPDGQRTRELTRRAGWCLGARNMSEGETVAACLEWNQFNTPPLSDEKVRSTVASIARAEAKKRQAETQQSTDGAYEKTRGTYQQAEEANQSTDRADENTRDISQREKIIAIGLDAYLWHDKDGNTFATVSVDQHLENFSIKGTAFRHWLTREYGNRYPMKVGAKSCPSAPSTQALTEALNALSAKAAGGAEHQAGIRIASEGGPIYLDLGTNDWSMVEISADGWRIVRVAPVRFIRPAGFRPLPVPVRGGSIRELSRFLHVAHANDFTLIVAWLLAALRPTGPYPVLIVNGEQGAGKTIICRLLRRLIDPNGAELRNDTRDERDLLLAAKNSWVVALDNLSYVRNDLSDAICRISTKGAFATRQLYTNDEEFLLEVCRPVLLNGIPPLASRADLADRAIVCTLPTMSDDRRRSEDDFWADFESAAPQILGALLDGVSGALRIYPSVKLKHSCRMMDFAKWAEAGCQALGFKAGAFEDAYRHNRSNASEDALEADPVAAALIGFMASKAEFEGTATELLSNLEGLTLPRNVTDDGPRTPRG